MTASVSVIYYHSPSEFSGLKQQSFIYGSGAGNLDQAWGGRGGGSSFAGGLTHVANEWIWRLQLGWLISAAPGPISCPMLLNTMV